MNVAELVASLGLKVNMDGFNEAVEGFNKLREHIHKVVEVLALLEGVKVLHEWIEQTTEAAVEIKHLSERLNTSAESIQQLGYAADVTGADVSTMQGALQRLQLGMEHATQTGQGPLVQALGKLKIPFSELKKLKPDEQFQRLADGFADAGPEVNKTAVAMEVFGRNIGPRLIPLLNKGGDGIRELREEFEATGAQIGDDTIEKFEDLEIQQKKLGYVWKGLKNEAVAALLPVLKDLVEGVMKWVKANRELIKQALEKVIHTVAIALKVLGAVFSVVIRVIKELLINWKAMAISLGIITAAFIIIKREAVLAGIKTAIAWVAALAPILLVAAAIAAVVLVVQDLYTWAEGGDSVFKDLYDSFVKYLGDTGVGKVIQGVIAGVKAIVGEIKDATMALINLGRRLGSKAAWITQRNRAVREINERGAIMIDKKTGAVRRMNNEEIEKEAEETADYNIKQIEAEEEARDNKAGGYRGLGDAAKPAFDPWAVKPTVSPQNQTNNNTMTAHITIQGVEKGEKQISEAVVKQIGHWWDSMSRHTHAATTAGARRP